MERLYFVSPSQRFAASAAIPWGALQLARPQFNPTFSPTFCLQPGQRSNVRAGPTRKPPGSPSSTVSQQLRGRGWAGGRLPGCVPLSTLQPWHRGIHVTGQGHRELRGRLAPAPAGGVWRPSPAGNGSSRAVLCFKLKAGSVLYDRRFPRTRYLGLGAGVKATSQVYR